MPEETDTTTIPSVLTLHVWPSQWELPSLDPQCIAAILYMQLTFPGRYSIVECTDPDQSPSGQLPFLTHEHHEISPLPSIMSYLESLARSEARSTDISIDGGLNGSDAQRSVAWKAYIISQLGDILAHQLYVEHYWTFTRSSLAQLMPFPQRLYVPGRLRRIHRPRLEAIGMWDAHYIEEPEAPKPTTRTPEQPGVPPAQVYKHAFARERLLDKARAVFGLLAKLLNEQEFICGDGPTSIDIILASYILPILYIPFPNSALSAELRKSYETLSAHAERILEYARTQPAPILPAATVRSSVSALINGLRKDTNVFAPDRASGPAADKEAAFKHSKWIFGLVAGVGSVVYLLATGIISVQTADDDEVEVNDTLDLDELEEDDDE